MRRSFGVLPSILVIASLLALISVFASLTQVTVVKAENASSLFVFIDSGSSFTQISNRPPGPDVYYTSSAPIMMAEELAGGGKVVSGGIIYGLRGTVNQYTYYFREGEMDNLFNCIFKWLKPDAENVLWLEGSAVYDRNWISKSSAPGSEGCKAFADALRTNFGYTMVSSAATITTELLENYDILVLPQLQAPGISDDEISAIVTWVHGGGRLVVLNSSDYFAESNPLLSNGILEALGATHLFQHDQINVGGIFHFYARVDQSTPIGASYGASQIYIASTCSLRRSGRSVSVVFQLEHKSGLPGDTLEYLITVQNGGDDPETFTLTPSDTAGWVLQIEPSVMALDNVGSDGATSTAILSVTIPEGASLGTDDVITVTATSEDLAVTYSDSCFAHAALEIAPTDDAYVETSQPDSNFGSELKIRVGTFQAYWENAFLKFDLSSIPAGATIQGAKLYLWCYSTYAGTGVRAHPVNNDSWSEGTITWNAAPSFDNEDILDKYDYITIPNQVYFWDVTSFVQSQYAGDKIASLALTPPPSTSESHNVSFSAKENLDWAPYLAVTYTSPSSGISLGIVVGAVVVVVVILGAVLIFVKPF